MTAKKKRKPTKDDTHPRLFTPEQRVDELVADMASGAWLTHDADYYCRRWGVTIKTLGETKRIAFAALRIIEDGTAEDFRTQLRLGITAIRRLCLMRTKQKKVRLEGERLKLARAAGLPDYELVDVPNPDMHNALKSIELEAKMLGLLEFDTPGEKAHPFSGWSHDELDAYVKRGEIPDGKSVKYMH